MGQIPTRENNGRIGARLVSFFYCICLALLLTGYVGQVCLVTSYVYELLSFVSYFLTSIDYITFLKPRFIIAFYFPYKTLQSWSIIRELLPLSIDHTLCLPSPASQTLCLDPPSVAQPFTCLMFAFGIITQKIEKKTPKP